MFKLLSLIFTLSLWQPEIQSVVVPIDIPDFARDCYRRHSYNVSITQVPSQVIANICIKEIEWNADQYDVNGPSPDAEKYVESLLRKIFRDHLHRRQKRQLGIRSSADKRREVRLLSDREWGDFVGRVNELKRREDVRPNRYDAIASLHRGRVIPAVHGGPPFLAFHRVYLLVMEAALGVTIPYWNSTVDFSMENPVNSLLWTDARFGDGVGAVNTGPFGLWVTPVGRLTRYIGSDGSLMSHRLVDLVLSRRSASEISEGTKDTNVLFSLEGQHNSVHLWVDGLMAGTNTAAYDPIFFLHHAYIDYIWHLFQRQQRLSGIDPLRDYPEALRDRHIRNDTLAGFRGLRNIHGYHRYFDDLTEYEDLPQSCGGCRNIFGMECRMGRCVPIENHTSFMASNGVSLITNANVPADGEFGFHERPQARPEINVGERFNTHIVDIRTRNDALQNRPFQRLRRRMKRFAGNPSEAMHYGEGGDHMQHGLNLTDIYKNSYVLNGVYDPSKWVYIKVKVIYARFSDQSHSSVQLTHRQATFNKCMGTNANEANVWVETNGINYSGRFKKLAHFVNNNNMQQSGTVLVGIKNPYDHHVESYVTAHDTCGRACIPLCYDVSVLPATYRHCSGAVRVTKDAPAMYTENESGHTDNSMVSPIIFMCDLSLSWPWRQYL